jgi:hypothetical protein
MSRYRLKAPSPAFVVATAALFVALGGTSYAVFKVGTKNLRNGAVTTAKLHNGAVTNKKIANGAVTKNKINTTGLTVPRAVHATNASRAGASTFASTAAHAFAADESGAGAVRAYAHMNANGTIDSSLSSGISSANVSHTAGSGIYCLHGLSFTPKSIVATPDSFDGPTSTQASVKSSAFVFCPVTDQVELVTYDPNTGAGAFTFLDRPVYLQLLG